jgi:hypothetical protein
MYMCEWDILLTPKKDTKGHSAPQTREYIDWQWSLSGVHSIMMVFSVQLDKGEGSTPKTQRLGGPYTPFGPACWTMGTDQGAANSNDN